MSLSVELVSSAACAICKHLSVYAPLGRVDGCGGAARQGFCGPRKGPCSCLIRAHFIVAAAAAASRGFSSVVFGSVVPEAPLGGPQCRQNPHSCNSRSRDP